MNLTNVKAGAKIILTEDFSTKPQSTWNKGFTLPKNLVLSLVSLHITRFGKSIILQVVRAKPVIEKHYGQLNADAYTSTYSWKKGKGYRIIRLYRQDAQEFIDLAQYRDFDEEYLELTHNDYKK